MGLQFPHALSVLLLLFPVFLENTKASEEGSSSHSDSTTVSLLFCLLLFLLVLLFLALRRLSRDSEGRCHPRRLVGALIRRWQALRGELPQDEEQRVEELEEPEQQQDMEAEEQLQQEDNQEERQEDLNDSINSETPEEAELQHPPEEDGTKATEGSAEALLSDLHSFSGTAAWEDSGKHFHVTTL
uniref:protein tyrosine phosphatase receptor type C-associated protein n=1 Tax=Euleptes europaea TaxID=460621 RepID=UPI0025421261|nr:protein tyrosine phosphatase receptor type C-associated protein [Euleptes europaea]